jgi:hypothetical protein
MPGISGPLNYRKTFAWVLRDVRPLAGDNRKSSFWEKSAFVAGLTVTGSSAARVTSARRYSFLICFFRWSVLLFLYEHAADNHFRVCFGAFVPDAMLYGILKARGIATLVWEFRRIARRLSLFSLEYRLRTRRCIKKRMRCSKDDRELTQGRAGSQALILIVLALTPSSASGELTKSHYDNHVSFIINELA